MSSKPHTDPVYKEKRVPKGPIKFNITLDDLQKEVKTFIEDHPISLLVADPGCGKTTIAMYYALMQLRKKNFERIIITKPIVEVGASMGFLPGTAEEKIASYLESYETIIDVIVGKQEREKLFSQEKVVFKPIQYVRGNNFLNAIIIFDEAQGCTLHELISFVTRMGDSSKMIILTDPFQSDVKKSGITDFLKIMKDIKGVGIKELDERFQKRSALIQEIYKKYKKFILEDSK